MYVTTAVNNCFNDVMILLPQVWDLHPPMHGLMQWCVTLQHANHPEAVNTVFSHLLAQQLMAQWQCMSLTGKGCMLY